MSEPHTDLLAKYEALRGQPKLFHHPLDGDNLDRFVRERCDLLGAHVNLIPRSTQRNPRGKLENPGVDSLDGDVINPEFLDFKDLDERKLNIACLVVHQPTKQLLKKYGVDEMREIIFHFPFSLLKEKGLVNDVKFRGLDIGDLIEWDGTFYIVWNVHRDTYFGESDRFFFTSGMCDRYRHDSIDVRAHRETDP